MNIEIANRLQKLRKEKGYSQEQLAEELGISRQAVSKWERAESSPDTDNLICLAKLYGVSLDYLLSTDDSIEVIKTEQLGLEDRDEDDEIDNDDESSPIMNMISTSTVMLCTIGFFLLGFGWNLWHPGWIIFIFIPVVITFAEAIRKKDATRFAYPVLVTVIYLLLGSVWNLWHPGWIIFITIPIYYVIAEAIRDKSQRNVSED